MDKNMTLNEYQKKAYSTAVFGGELNYPMAAFAEETGEVCLVWSEWLLNAEYLKANWTEVKAKLLDELGDVCWNLAVLCELLDVPLEDVDKYASTAHTNNSVTISYYFCKLAGAVGKLNGIWAKWIRKHDGAEKKVADVRDEVLRDPETLRAKMMSQCIIILHVLYNLFKRLELDFNEVMEHNIEKLAARKAANTLGGKGSVERK